MRSDGGMLWYLLNKIRGGGASNDRGNTPAFGFDGTDDYISSNATIGRTGYDMNVSGNVSTGSDGDGSYIQFNGSYRRDLTTGTIAKIGGTSYSISQAGSFSCSCTFKVVSLAVDNNTSGLFGISNVCSIYMTNNTGGAAFRIRNGASFVDVNMSTLSTGTLYKCHLVYDASVTKVYCYVDGVLQNSGGTLVSFSFSGSGWSLGDDGVGGGNHTSANKYIYHACIRNKALTQAEVDADIALGNTAKNDPTIVAYYIPGNLQYNTQYISNPKDLDNASRTKGTGTTVTADYATAPDGTATADRVERTGTDIATSKCDRTFTTLTGSSLASKTFIVKAFVRVASGTDLFRLRCSHGGVADYYSSNQTATTVWQEFTFTQAFTSSGSGTGITAGLVIESALSAVDLEVRNVRCFLVNETLRDESPNIGGFIGWKTPLVMSARVKPGVDAADTTSSQVIIKAPRHYLHLRSSTNIVYRRSETTLQARIAGNAGTAILGTGNRNKVNILGVKYRDGTGRRYKSYVNGVLTSGSQTAYSTTLRPASTIYTTQLLVGKDNTATYYTGNERDARIYTFTGSFTDADALAIYNGGEPTSAGVTKYLHYKPLSGEIGTATSDLSTNLRDGTLNNGVTRTVV